MKSNLLINNSDILEAIGNSNINELKNRGVKDILIASIDGLS